MSGFVEALAWVACVIYATIPSFWLMIHPRPEYWRTRTLSPYKVLLPLWVAMWIALGAVTWRWRHLHLYPTPLAWIPGILFLVCGTSLYVLGGKKFTGSQLGGRPEIEIRTADQRLITSGIRAHVRHPIYLGHLCEMVGWSIGSGLLVLFGLTAFAVITGAIMILHEDRELEARFGESYRQYRARVPAVIPSLRK
jgi:protein-S-isoprenylcysteine O-methyltransferase Ste14